MPPINLRNKILIGALGLIVILGSLVIFFIVTTVPKKLNAELQRKGVILAKNIAIESVRDLLNEGTVDLVLNLHRHKRIREDIKYILILDHEGKVSAHTFEETFPADLKEINTAGGEQKYNIQHIDTKQGKIIDVAVPILGGELGVVRVGISAEPVKESISNIVRGISFIIVGVLILVAGVTVILVRSVTMPISELTNATKIIANGDLKYEINVRSNDEIGQLASAFNQMTKNLKTTTVKRDELVQEVIRRNRAEEALRESEERYRTFFEQAPDGIILVDSDTRAVLAFNKKAHENLGYTRGEFQNLRISDLEVIESEEDVTRHVEKIIRQGSDVFETKYKAKDGQILDILVSAQAVSNDGRKYIQSILKDITKRKEAERALRESENKFRTIFDSVTDGIFLAHPDNKKFYMANEKICQMLGYSMEEIKNIGVKDIHPDESLPYVFDQFEQVSRNEIKGTKDIPVKRRDGNIFYVDISTSFIALEGKTYVLGIFRDITERKKMEDTIQHQLKRFNVLRFMDMTITASLDLGVTLDILLIQVTTQLGIDAASVLLLNQKTQTLEYVANKGFRSNALKYTRLKMGESNAGRAALKRCIVTIPNLKEEPDGFMSSRPFAGEDFISYFAIPLIARDQVKGVLELFHRSYLGKEPDWLEFLENVADQAAIAVDNSCLFNELSQAYDTTIEGWSRALDLRDKETKGHTQRVTEMTICIAREFGIVDEELVHIKRGALLHDIGKLGIPDNILLKPGSLTDEEWMIMKLHPQFANDMLFQIDYLRRAIDIPYYHHEKWDGTGYPGGLKGEEIPLAARIFAVVDVWDALRSDRPYRPAWPEEKVLEHIRSLAGIHFDPKVVEVFLEMERKKIMRLSVSNS